MSSSFVLGGIAIFLRWIFCCVLFLPILCCTCVRRNVHFLLFVALSLLFLPHSVLQKIWGLKPFFAFLISCKMTFTAEVALWVTLVVVSWIKYSTTATFLAVGLWANIRPMYNSSACSACFVLFLVEEAPIFGTTVIDKVRHKRPFKNNHH